MPIINLQKRLPNLSPEEEVIYFEAILEAYNWGRTDAAKWIPVGDRLPDLKEESFEDFGEKIIYHTTDFVLGYTTAGDVVTVMLEITNEGKHYWTDFVGADYRITHWMPLPATPKGENNED